MGEAQDDVNGLFGRRIPLWRRENDEIVVSLLQRIQIDPLAVGQIQSARLVGFC